MTVLIGRLQGLMTYIVYDRYFNSLVIKWVNFTADMCRVKARLNALRVPIGATVRLRFQRRLSTQHEVEDESRPKSDAESPQRAGEASEFISRVSSGGTSTPVKDPQSFSAAESEGQPHLEMNLTPMSPTAPKAKIIGN